MESLNTRCSRPFSVPKISQIAVLRRSEKARPEQSRPQVELFTYDGLRTPYLWVRNPCLVRYVTRVIAHGFSSVLAFQIIYALIFIIKNTKQIESRLKVPTNLLNKEIPKFGPEKIDTHYTLTTNTMTSAHITVVIDLQLIFHS
jgi:hypothetical protein